jgi:hypothetical protein
MFERFDQPVRCSAGHVFTTIWIPLASLKSVRLSGQRFQHCPVGRHWATVVPIDPNSATPRATSRRPPPSMTYEFPDSSHSAALDAAA